MGNLVFDSGNADMLVKTVDSNLHFTTGTVTNANSYTGDNLTALLSAGG